MVDYIVHLDYEHISAKMIGVHSVALVKMLASGTLDRVIQQHLQISIEECRRLA